MKRKPHIRFSCRKIIINRNTDQIDFYSKKITSSKFEGLQNTPHKGGAQNRYSPVDEVYRKVRREPEELTG
jgi:hypothetical protein